MFQRSILFQSSNVGGAFWLPIFLTGVALVCFGVMILMHPEILAYLVAGMLIFFGSSVIAFSFALKPGARSKRESRDIEIEL